MRVYGFLEEVRFSHPLLLKKCSKALYLLAFEHFWFLSKSNLVKRIFAIRLKLDFLS